MEGESILQTMAEIAVAFAGFTGVAAAVGLVSLGAMVTQVMNALGVFFHRGFGAFLLGVAALLVLSSLMFVRLLSFVHRGGGTE